MPTITFIDVDENEHRLRAEVGQSVMQVALFASVPGITADCGGACSCATCHAYVDEAWLGRLPAPEGQEKDMLEYADARQSNSRLTCQLSVTDEMDGLVLRLPEPQY